MNELVSVIVPVYNVEEYLDDTIKSVFNQTYSNWELILVDDGSTDKSRNICLSYQKKDSRVLVIHTTNGGVSKARNTGLKLMHGRWFMFLDSDDLLKSNAIATAVEQTTKSDIVIFGTESFPEKQNICITRQKFYSGFQDMNQDFSELYQASAFNSPCNKLYRHKERIEPFDEGLSMGEDLLFNLKYLQRCTGIVVIPEKLNCYRRDRPDSLSRKWDKNSIDIQVRLKNALDKSFDFKTNVVCETQRVFIRTMIDKMYSVLYSDSISKDEKKSILSDWLSEQLLYCGGDNVKDIGVTNKIFLLCVKNRFLWIACFMALLRKKMSKLIHRIR